MAGCKILAGGDYLTRHNKALMVVAVEWGKKEGIFGDERKWYKERWKQGETFENNGKKIIWDFEYKLRKTSSYRRPDLILEDNESKIIFIIDMACPMEMNIEKKTIEKLQKYRQIAFETREKRRGYKVRIVPLIVGCMGGGIRRVQERVGELFDNRETISNVVSEMSKVVVWESESIIRKVMSGITQTL